MTSTGGEVRPARAWLAISAATLVATVGYWAILLAFASGARDGSFSAGAFALGLAIVPFVFVALAFLSGHDRAPLATLAGMGLFLLVAPPVALVDVVSGTVAGLGAGGVVALRKAEGHAWRSRILAVVAASLLVLVLLLVLPPLAVVLAPALPFTSIGLADMHAERRWRASPRDAGDTGGGRKAGS